MIYYKSYYPCRITYLICRAQTTLLVSNVAAILVNYYCINCLFLEQGIQIFPIRRSNPIKMKQNYTLWNKPIPNLETTEIWAHMHEKSYMSQCTYILSQQVKSQFIAKFMQPNSYYCNFQSEFMLFRVFQTEIRSDNRDIGVEIRIYMHSDM